MKQNNATNVMKHYNKPSDDNGFDSGTSGDIE